MLGTENGLFAEEETPNRPKEIKWRDEADLSKPGGALEREQASKILKAAKSKIELLRDRFIEAKLAHAFLLDVVLTQAAGLEAKT